MLRVDRALVLAAALAAPGFANAAMGWAKGGDMCAGIDTECDSMETCTLTAFGPCETADAGATQYLSSQFVGLAFVKESDYLTNPSSMFVVDPSTDDTNGYRDFETDVVAGDSTYAYTMTGGRFGSSDIGGYVGIVSYLNQGDADITTNNVAVRWSDFDTTARNANADTGEFGAPLGPEAVCISELDDGTCGDDRTFTPGEYKFSIFGITMGSSYPPTAGEDPIPDYTHLGVRMKLVANNFDVTTLAINGDKTLENIGNDDVETLTLGVESGEVMVIDFPQKYNVGSVTSDGPVYDQGNTRDIKIKISDASSGTEQALYIDYLFDASESGGIDETNRFFIYDPDVSVQASDPYSPAAAAGFVVGLFAAAAAMF